MASRLIVKNLPKNITEDKLRNLFSQKGNITDIQLKYTKDGIFRQFAFVGYQKESDAEEAINYFNKSCIQTSRIKVELCASLGSDGKPKSWSKHSIDSKAYRKAHGIDEIERQEKEKEWLEAKSKKKNKIEEILGDHKNDPEFIEFMEAHDKNRNLWANDANVVETPQDKTSAKVKTKKPIVKEIQLDNTDDVISTNKTSGEIENDSSNKSENTDDEEIEVSEKLATKNDISDLDYMKSLIKKSSEGKLQNKTSVSINKKTKKSEDLFTIKIHNIPYKTKRQDVVKFFKPIKPNSVRIPQTTKGFCYVGFIQEKDFKKAMVKDKSFIKGKQIFFSNFTEKNKISKSKSDDNYDETKSYEKNSKWAKQEESLKNEEDISESGKIFFRNLAYTISEDDIQTLFKTYGPIAEISLPIDPVTRKIKGFGTVTYVMPEHAVKAFNELDGSTFHGRLLHLIPGKSKDYEEPDENAQGLSFKAKKALKLKKSAGQSHNWNTLFLGANAVADILAKKFETTKETVLDSRTGGSSAAVRLALGETLIVTEMKKFLEENEVQLDAFETSLAKRSNTIILAKNLPAETTVEELSPLFAKFGLIGRIVLPPSGVTALIEFFDASEAKKAFRKLAYSKFKNLPLYLEWAPENTFRTNLDGQLIQTETKKVEEKQKTIKNIKEKDEEKCQIPNANDEKLLEENTEHKDDDDDDDDSDMSPEPDTTLFLRNLNFKTREDAVKNHFKHLGPIHIVQVAMRKDPENPKNVISLGYGFIQFKRKVTTERALKEMQLTKIEGNTVELKRSDRTLKLDEKSAKKKAKVTAQTGTKILVRNIPFQAKTKEIFEIFKAFGELRSVRLPKKMTPGEESHRGFGFVDYITKGEAKKAFEALGGSTHLYGRRLVLEWAANNDNDVEELRKRTAETYHEGSKTKRSRKAVFDGINLPEVNESIDD